MESSQTNSACGNEQVRRRSLITEIRLRDGREAAKLLMGELPNVAGRVLLEFNPGQTTAILERFSEDFDSATASSIFLTTATDIASMGCFVGLATILVL